MPLKVGRGASAPPFIVMDVIANANRRQRALAPGAPGVIHMEVGQPGTGAPAGAVRAVQAALAAGHPLGYTEAFGLPSLRARIAAHYADWYGLAVAPERIAVTTGASGAFPLAFLAAFDPGDRVALTSPYYPPYLNILTALGMTPVVIEAGEATRYQPDVAMLDRLDPRPDGLIVASPSNPAGTMLHPEELAAIAAWCDREGVRLVSDEIYHGLNYASPIATATASSPHAVVVNSFSKYFSMTGWRIGWLRAAGGPRAPGRAPGAEPLHQRAARRAGRRRGRVRLPRRIASECRPLPPLARSAAGRAAEGRVSASLGRGGRILPLRRHRRPHE